MRTAARALTAVFLLLVAAPAPGQSTPSPMAFTVSTPDPASHLFHVVMRVEGLPGAVVDFQMPVWTPGYYGTFDYAGHVRDFAATDGEGRELPWQKVGANTWRVAKDTQAMVQLAYQVFADNPFVAAAFLDETRGYITPGALFLYVPGQLDRPVTVAIDLHPTWNAVATGMDRIADPRAGGGGAAGVPGTAPRAARTAAGTGHTWTFAAPDFDVLYDSPILMGHLESLPPFEVEGIPHRFIAFRPGEFDRTQLMADLKAVVEAGTAIIGDIPYPHYTFIGIGPGRGGIEHANSTAVSFAPAPGMDRAARIRLLSFLAHEYFHHYNVKRIRPIALGPFDYSRETVTDMLWVSEGFTSYYENLMLARAGIMTLDEVLARMGSTIASVENNTGRLFQSAAESSRLTWAQGPFGGRGGGLRKTISYYEKGTVLGMFLDFRIRHETENARSLDTVMRALYEEYDRNRGRGWTDREFRDVAERTAGVPLTDFFAYADTTADLDYTTYLSYAGLEMAPAPQVPDAYLGALCEDTGGRTVVAAVEPGSPAASAALRPGDVVESFDGRALDAAGLARVLSAKQPGDRVTLATARGGERREVVIGLGDKVERSFRLQPVANPTPLQAAVLKSWIKPIANARTSTK